MVEFEAPLHGESGLPMREVAIVIDGLPVVVEMVQAAPVVELVAPAPAVTYLAPAPVFEFVAPAPPVPDAASAPVDELDASTPAASYATSAPVVDFVAPAPAVTHAALALVVEHVAQCMLRLTPPTPTLLLRLPRPTQRLLRSPNIRRQLLWTMPYTQRLLESPSLRLATFGSARDWGIRAKPSALAADGSSHLGRWRTMGVRPLDSTL